MALSISKVRGADHVRGNKREKVRDITFDSVYAAGGESLTPADVDLKVIEQVIPHGPAISLDSGGNSAVIVAYDYANEKLMAFVNADPGGSGGDEVPLPEADGGDDLSAYTVRVTIVGY